MLIIKPETATELTIFKFKHLNKQIVFAVDQEKQLHLVQQTASKTLIKDGIVSASPVSIFTRFNPNYLLLQLLSFDLFLDLDDLELPFNTLDLDLICTSVQHDSTILYRLDLPKILAWLKSRVDAIILKYNDIRMFPSSDFDHLLSASERSEQRIKYSLALVADNLTDELRLKLMEYLGVQEQVIVNEPVIDVAPQENTKKCKVEKKVEKKKPTKSSRGVLALAKASTSGMKSITSFFKK